MSPVDFKKCQYHMSLSVIYAHVACRIKEMALSHVEFKKWSCRMSISSMSYVEFRKWQCHPVDFRGQGPLNESLRVVVHQRLRRTRWEVIRPYTGERD